MTRYHLLLGIALGAATLLLTGAGDREDVLAPTATPPALPPEDPDVLLLLERSAVLMQPDRLFWVETTLWQRLHWEDLTCETTGRYLLAPGLRMRLDLHVKTGKADGRLKLVSDGKVLWRWQGMGDGEPKESRSELPKKSAIFNADAAVEYARGALLGDQAYLGVSPLLWEIRRKLQRAGRVADVWNGREVIRVTGAWPADPKQFQDVAPEHRPRTLPEVCSVFLDAKTLWPCRVEWWSSSALLLEMEFRDPVLNVPLPAERLASEFAVPPGPSADAGNRGS